MGKPPQGRIRLSTRVDDSLLYIEIADDGAGLDTRSLQRAALLAGLDVDGIAPEKLIFVEGLSSREQATELSGRGVGMSALRQACEENGGTVHVSFVPNGGTTLSLSFPRPVVKLGALAEKLERRWSVLPRTGETESGTQRISAQPLIREASAKSTA